MVRLLPRLTHRDRLLVDYRRDAGLALLHDLRRLPPAIIVVLLEIVCGDEPEEDLLGDLVVRLVFGVVLSVEGLRISGSASPVLRLLRCLNAIRDHRRRVGRVGAL